MIIVLPSLDMTRHSALFRPMYIPLGMKMKLYLKWNVSIFTTMILKKLILKFLAINMNLISADSFYAADLPEPE